jgi:hypothetical protein
MKPGVKPHCTAPAATNASCTRWSDPPGATPSTVTTSWPSACAARTRHEQTSLPSRSTEHEPHSPCSHAFLEPGSRCSRSAKSRRSPSHTSTAAPVTISATARHSRARPASTRGVASVVGTAIGRRRSGLPPPRRLGGGGLERKRPARYRCRRADCGAHLPRSSATTASEHTAITIALRGRPS